MDTQKFTVLKPFPHPSRRFAVGDVVTEVDLIGCAVLTADLKKGKFIAGSDTAAAEKATASADAETSVDESIPVAEFSTSAQEERAVLESGADKFLKR